MIHQVLHQHLVQVNHNNQHIQPPNSASIPILTSTSDNISNYISDNNSSDYMVNFLRNNSISETSESTKPTNTLSTSSCSKINNFIENQNKMKKSKKINICIDIEELESDVTINIGKKLTINM